MFLLNWKTFVFDHFIFIQFKNTSKFFGPVTFIVIVPNVHVPKIILRPISGFGILKC